MVRGRLIQVFHKYNHLSKAVTFEWYQKWSSYTGLTVAMSCWQYRISAETLKFLKTLFKCVWYLKHHIFNI